MHPAQDLRDLRHRRPLVGDRVGALGQIVRVLVVAVAVGPFGGGRWGRDRADEQQCEGASEQGELEEQTLAAKEETAKAAVEIPSPANDVVSAT